MCLLLVPVLLVFGVDAGQDVLRNMVAAFLVVRSAHKGEEAEDEGNNTEANNGIQHGGISF